MGRTGARKGERKAKSGRAMGAVVFAFSICNGAACVRTACTRAAERPAVREEVDLQRRELARSRSAPPLVGARILERVFSLCPVECAGEPLVAMAERAGATLSLRPVPFSLQLVAEVRAARWVSDHSDDGPPVARMLLAAARLRDEDVTPYTASPGERGPAPSPSLVRMLALGALAHSQIGRWRFGWSRDPGGEPMDSARYAPLAALAQEVERHLLDRLTKTTDDRELLLLQPFATDYLGWDAPGQLDHAGPRRSLLEAWLADLPRRLAGPADRVSLEIVLARVACLSWYGMPPDLAAASKAVLRNILSARGHVPLTATLPGAAWDLLVTAASTLHDVEAPGRAAWIEPTPRRMPFDPWADWLDLEPAGSEPSAADVRGRLRDLDRELARLRFAPGRTYALEEEARWLPPGDARRRFGDAAASLFEGREGANLRFDTEAMRRASILLGTESVDAAPRIALARRLLEAPLSAIDAFDGRADDHDHFTIHEPLVGKRALRILAAGAVWRHPDWIARDAALRGWLEDCARSRVDTAEPGRAACGDDAEPALEALLRVHASRAVGADADVGRAILGGWIDALRDAVRCESCRRGFPDDRAVARLLVIGELSPRLGRMDEARALFDALRTVAADGRHAAPMWREIAWAEDVARAMLEAPSPDAAP